ncbi:unnamed protein product [Arabidopsis arenosa]|uniref:Putative plant transposon protein domain-containing protein n=1 Tax=Arabidopsis arenosa TaxID=38785 RepID=A0A8S1ZN05_ARAAE|nr:unnamed protein product [Arabidopsis arenosa]
MATDSATSADRTDAIPTSTAAPSVSAPSSSLPNPTSPIPVLVPKSEPGATKTRKVKAKNFVQPPKKKHCGVASSSRPKSKHPTPITRRPSRRAAAARTSDDIEDITGDANDEDVAEIPPPAFLARYQANRKLIAIRERKYPELKFSSVPSVNTLFITETARDRYQGICKRRFNEMSFLAPDCVSTQAAYKIISDAGLLPTITEIDTFVEQVVLVFYANLPDAEVRETGELMVFVRGSMYEFSPTIINQMFQLSNPIFPVNVHVTDIAADLDDVAAVLSSGRVTSWNWMPTVNSHTLKPGRSTLLYMVVKKHEINFGKLVYDEVWNCSQQVASPSSTWLLIFLNLIDQLLRFQRIVPELDTDVTSAAPQRFTFEIKGPFVPAGPATLTADLALLMATIKTVLQRLTGGDYADVVHVVSHNSDEGGVKSIVGLA